MSAAGAHRRRARAVSGVVASATPRGRLITFEGPEGGGKSTQIALLAARLRESGLPVLLTREPGGTAIGIELRAALLVPERPAPAARTQALLVSADRAQHVIEVIRPALESGTAVLSDRFFDSTLAYQGFGEGLDLDDLEHITAFATAGLRPDLTVLVDVDVEIGLARRRAAFKAGEGELNRIDRRDRAYHQRVRSGYHALAAREPDRFLIVDGTLGPEAIAEVVWRRVAPLVEGQVPASPGTGEPAPGAATAAGAA